MEVRTEPLTIAARAGLGDGARMRVGGKGNAGRNGGEYGDLYITVHVQPHPLFRREGDDLHLVVPVAIHEAALGTRFEVPSLEGQARVRVPPGTQSGQRFRLRERGVASLRDGRRGDLVVEVRVVLPALLDERSKELLREFGRINSEDVRKGLTSPRPRRRPARRYMISAVAQRNIQSQTLRLYERRAAPPSRTEEHASVFEEDLERLETILSLTRDLGVNLAGVEIILNMRRKIERMQHEVNEFMEYVKGELSRGIDDWEQRLSTALVKSSSTDLVRAAPPAAETARVDEPARKKTS